MDELKNLTAFVRILNEVREEEKEKQRLIEYRQELAAEIKAERLERLHKQRIHIAKSFVGGIAGLGAIACLYWLTVLLALVK